MKAFLITFLLAPFMSPSAMAQGAQCSPRESGRSDRIEKVSVTKVKVEVTANDRGVRERCYKFKTNNKELNDLIFTKDRPCLFDSEFGGVLYNAWNNDQFVSLNLQEIIYRPHCNEGTLGSFDPDQSEENRFEIAAIVLTKKHRGPEAIPSPDIAPAAQSIARVPRVIKPRTTPMDKLMGKLRQPINFKSPVESTTAEEQPTYAEKAAPQAPAENNNNGGVTPPAQEIPAPHTPLVVERIEAPNT